MIRYLALFSMIMSVSACSSIQLHASGDARGREALACADIGIDSGSSAFDQCIGNLDQSEWELASNAGR